MRKLLLFVLGIAGSACAETPFGWEERLQHYLRRTYSWQRMALLAADAGFDQVTGEPAEWGREPHAFGYRYSSGFGKRVVRNSIELLAGAALDEDARFQPSGRAAFRGRIRHALRQAFLARGDRFAYSRLAGTVGGVVLTSRWRPRSLTPWRFGEGIAFGYVGHLENSFLEEFGPDLKRWGRSAQRKLFRRPGN